MRRVLSIDNAALLAVLVMVLCFVYPYVVFTTSELPGSLSSDSASYLLIARYFTFWEPRSEAVVAAFHEYAYPPFFPAISAMLGMAYHIKWHFYLNAIFFLLSILLYFRFVSRETRKPGLALLACAMVMSFPGTWIAGIEIGSEHLYLLLSLGVLNVLDSVQKKGLLVVIAAIALASTILTRTIGVSMVVAVIAYLFLQREKLEPTFIRRYGFMVGFTVVTAITWSIMAPAYKQTYLSLIKPVVLSTFGVDNGYVTLIDVIGVMLSAIPIAIKQYLFWFTGAATITAVIWLLAAIFLCAAAIGLYLRLRQKKLDALYVIFYLVILFVWPYPNQMLRFIFPIMPLLLFYALSGGQNIITEFCSKKICNISFYTSIALIFLLNAAALSGINTRAHRTPELYRHSTELYTTMDESQGLKRAIIFKESMRDMEQFAELTENGAIIAAPKANFLSLLSGRRGVSMLSYKNAAGFCELKNDDVDYAYVSQVVAAGTNDGLDAIKKLLPFSSVVWMRNDNNGAVAAVLLHLNKQKLKKHMHAMDMTCPSA
jgi:hypothetical protein